jgi:hypothetical protein
LQLRDLAVADIAATDDGYPDLYFSPAATSDSSEVSKDEAPAEAAKVKNNIPGMIGLTTIL